LDGNIFRYKYLEVIGKRDAYTHSILSFVTRIFYFNHICLGVLVALISEVECCFVGLSRKPAVGRIEILATSYYSYSAICLGNSNVCAVLGLELWEQGIKKASKQGGSH
jgi:hypothetical protein